MFNIEKLSSIAKMLLMVLLITFMSGCATKRINSYLNDQFHETPIHSDEVFGIALTSPELQETLKSEEAIALLGYKNTYMLFKGGGELNLVSNLNLDGNRMDIDSARSQKLYLKDIKFWGSVTLTYRGQPEVSNEEKLELEQAGFIQIRKHENNPMIQAYRNTSLYQKQIYIEGIIFPAAQMSESQASRLTIHRPFKLYPPLDENPPFSLAGFAQKSAAVAADVVLVPATVTVMAVGFLSYVGAMASLKALGLDDSSRVNRK